MNAERLLALYDRVCEAPDAIPRLRRFILDLAVRGRLVEQDPNHEPATELLKRITIENSKRKEDRRKRTSVKAIDRSEAPFVIPSTWVWVPLGFVTRIRTGKLDANAAVKGGRYPFFTCSQVSSEIDSYSFDTAAVLLAGNGDFNLKCYEGKFDAYQRTYVIEPVAWDLGYCFVVLRSQISRITDNQRGSAIPYLKLADISDPLIPLPPLPEQHRIVSKVDELMALCDSLEAERKKREATRDRLTTASLSRLAAPDGDERQFKAHADFAIRVLPELTSRPDQIKVLRQTILDLAVRGKLVEQNPNDEPALHLLRRSDETRERGKNRSEIDRYKIRPDFEEAPFDLPELWHWTRFGDLHDLVRGVTYTKSDVSDSNSSGYIGVLRANNIGPTLNLDNPVYVKRERVGQHQLLRRGDYMIALSSGSKNLVGKAAYVAEDLDAAFGGFCGVIRLTNRALRGFVGVYIQSDLYRSSISAGSRGIGINNLKKDVLASAFFPLPPLAEQHRIVAKIDDLMVVCDQLEQRLESRLGTRRRLLQAVLVGAMEPQIIEAA